MEARKRKPSAKVAYMEGGEAQNNNRKRQKTNQIANTNDANNSPTPSPQTDNNVAKRAINNTHEVDAIDSHGSSDEEHISETPSRDSIARTESVDSEVELGKERFNNNQ